MFRQLSIKSLKKHSFVIELITIILWVISILILPYFFPESGIGSLDLGVKVFSILLAITGSVLSIQVMRNQRPRGIITHVIGVIVIIAVGCFLWPQ